MFVVANGFLKSVLVSEDTPIRSDVSVDHFGHGEPQMHLGIVKDQ